MTSWKLGQDPRAGCALLVGPPSRGREARLADTILTETSAHGPGAVRVVVPAHLARDRIVGGLLARRPGGLLLPRIDTLDDLVDTAGAERDLLLEGGARRALLGELIARLTARGHLRELGRARDFPGLVQALDHFFQSLGRHRVWDRRTLNTHVHIYRRGGLQSVDREILEIYDAYRQLVPVTAGGREPRGITRNERAARIIEDPRPLRDELAGARIAVLTGFDDFSPLQLQVLDALIRIVPRTIVTIDLVSMSASQPESWEDDRIVRALRALGARVEVDADALDEVGGIACDLAAGRLDVLPASRPARDPDRLSLTGYPDPIREVEGIARRVRALLTARSEPASAGEARGAAPAGASERSAAAGGGIAVAVASPERYLPLIREVFPRHGVPFRTRIGIPLVSVPPIAVALALLDTVAEGFRRSHLERLLQTPYLAIPGARSTGPGRLDTWAREAGVIGGNGRPETDWLDPLDALARRREKESRPPVEELAAARHDLAIFFDIVRPLSEMCRSPVTATVFISTLHRCLESLGVLGSGVEGVDHPRLRAARRRDIEAGRRFAGLLEDMRTALDMLPESPRLRLPDWVERLRALLAEETTAPLEEIGVSGAVPVVGIPDLRHLGADTVFIGGLTETDFPRRTRRELFYPEAHDPTRDFLLHPNPAVEDRITLMREVARHRACHLSWPRQIAQVDQLPAAIVERLAGVIDPLPSPETGGEAPVPDRVIAAARRALDGPDALAHAFAPILADPATAAGARTTLRGLRVAEHRLAEIPSRWTGFVSASDFGVRRGARYAPGGPHRYSATELESYARCPYRHFAERILRLGKIEDVEEEISPLTRGEILHTILHRFHARRLAAGERPPVRAETLATARAEMARIARDVFADLPHDDILGQAELASIAGGLDADDGEAPRRPSVLEEYLKTEIERGGAGWSPVALEWEFGARGQDALEIPTASGVVRVRGKVDRVDRHTDGWMLVLDYKSGATPGAHAFDDGTDFQLAVYLHAGATRPGAPGDARWDAAYYPLRVRDRVGPRRYLSGGRRPDSVDLPALAGSLSERMGRIADAIAGGSFPLTVLPDAHAPCRYCTYRILCRVDPGRTELRRTVLEASTRPLYLHGGEDLRDDDDPPGEEEAT